MKRLINCFLSFVKKTPKLFLVYLLCFMTLASCVSNGENSNTPSYTTNSDGTISMSVDDFMSMYGSDSNDNISYEEENSSDRYISVDMSSEESLSSEEESIHEHSYNEERVVDPTCEEQGYTIFKCECGDEYKDNYVKELGHTYTEVVVDPTCEEQGYTIYTCHCNHSYIDNYVEELGHSYGDWYLVNESSCEVEGTKRRDCNRCEHYEINVISATGHTYINEEIVEPTCDKQGYTLYTCECGYSYKDNYVEELGHSYGDWYIVNNVSCEAEGLERRDCSRCEHYETKVISATGHSYSNNYFIDEKGHWSNPTCEHNDAPSNKENHDYVDGVCIICGFTKETNDYVTFKLSEDGTYYIVYDCDSAAKCIIIPEFYNNLPVKVIGEYSFYGCNSLTSIKMPKGIISIEDSAFYGCSSLTSIVIPNGVTSIGSSAFSGCSSLKTVLIPNNVTSLGSLAFYGCNSLIIYCEKSYKQNGWDSNWNYSNCPVYWGINENNFIEKDGVQYVIQYGEAILTRYVGNDKSVVILSAIEINGTIYKMTSIGETSFSGCSSLINVYFSGTLEDWCVIAFGNEYSNPMYYASHFYMLDKNNEYKEVTRIEIPNTVTSIGNYQFYGFNNVTEIIIPSSVVSIGSSAFSSCDYLKRITIPFIGQHADGSGYRHFGYIFGAASYLANSSCIPSSLKEVIITRGASICYDSFYGCSSLTSIVIPNSVTSIGERAFSGCSSLTSIVIPSSVISIGEKAFYDCSSLERITLPFVGQYADGSGKTHFGYIFGAASYSKNSSYVPSSLKEVIITRGASICYDSFYGCSSLTSIVIPNSVTSIGERAFSGCSSLSSIEISNNITFIGNSAFSGCDLLINIYYFGSIEGWCKITFGNEYSNPMYYASHFYMLDENNEYKEVTRIEIPNTVTSIGNYQFYNFKNLTEIIFANNVISIGDSAFYNCRSLTSIVIPNSVINIGENAFYNCRSLITVIFDKESQLKIIGKNVFYYCSSLTNVYYSSSMENWCNITFSDVYSNPMYYASYFYVLDENNEYKEVTRIEIPNIVTSIGNYQFYNLNKVAEIIIPSSVTSIGENAFRNCGSLTTIVVPNSVKSIGLGAFSGCSSLENITLPFVGASATATGSNALFGYIFGYSSSTGGTGTKQYYASDSFDIYYIPNSLKEVTITGGTKIGYGAFYNCKSLISVFIPSSVTSIGEKAFYGCISLTIYCEAESRPSGWHANWNYSNRPVYWEMNESNFIEKDGIQYVIKNGEAIVSRYVGNDENVVIPSTIEKNGVTYSVTIIGDYAFSNCSYLISVVIPSGITCIEENAFNDCDFLNYNKYDNAYYLGNSENPYLVLVKAKDTSIISCIINKNTKVIASSAFYDCVSLKNIYYYGSIEDWCNIRFCYYYSNPMYYASYFYMLDEENGWKEVTRIEIPNTITSIGNYQFYGFNNLKEIIIPNSVTSIGENAFRNCGSLTVIVIPNGVTTIGSAAFYDCGKLTSIIIPNSVTSIENSAFYNCSSLSSVTFEEESRLISIGSSAFSHCTLLKTIVIPNSVTSIGDWAFCDCISLESITLPFVGQYADGSGATHFGYIFGASSYSKNSSYVPSSLKEVIITGGTIIGNYAFCKCYYLTSIVILNDVTSIGSSAFSGCSSLASIVIPNSVTNVGGSAFSGCSSLISLVIPNSVTSIGSRAFYNCSSLTIYCEAEEKPAGWDDEWNYYDRPVIWGYKVN